MYPFNKFEEKWMSFFAADISEEDIQNYVINTGGYIWHVFSWGLKQNGSFLCGDKARQAFDEQDKRGAQYY